MSKVNLRQKKIGKGRISLYLDFYPEIPNPATGKTTRREFLKLYIPEKPKSFEEKQATKETLQLAEAIKTERQADINKGRFGFLMAEKRNINFVDFFRSMAEKRKKSNHDNWISALYYFEQYTGGMVKMNDLNEQYCDGFREYLLNSPSRKSDKEPLMTNSAVSYFNKLKAALKVAYREGYLDRDVNSNLPRIKSADTNRDHLTLDELRKLAGIPCKKSILKRFAFFSAFTGLGHAELRNLTWGMIEKNESGKWVIKYQRKKTGNWDYLDICDTAYSFLGERGEAEEKVFPELIYSAHNNSIIKDWVTKAGIYKHITPHCFRHTFAVTQIQRGTDIYTLSKMMLHSSVTVTERYYAKHCNIKKREAADKMEGTGIEIYE